jgi:endoglucanase
MPKSGHLSQKLGGGACIKIMDASVFCHESMVAFLRKTADDNGIKWQSEILFAGGTDAGAIHKARGGVYTGAISIPTRYIHSACCVAAKEDLISVGKLARAMIERNI